MKRIDGPGDLVLELDPKQVFPKDPGAGTPAMVFKYKNGKEVASATFWCAQGEGELMSYDGGTVRLTKIQQRWLDSVEHHVDELFSTT